MKIVNMMKSQWISPKLTRIKKRGLTMIFNFSPNWSKIAVRIDPVKVRFRTRLIPAPVCAS